MLIVFNQEKEQGRHISGAQHSISVPTSQHSWSRHGFHSDRDTVSSWRNCKYTANSAFLRYYQPTPIVPTPFSVPALSDPNFASSCSVQSGNCAEAWGLRIVNSKDVLIYGAGLYSFFNEVIQFVAGSPWAREGQP
jgi:hypothetical protein